VLGDAALAGDPRLVNNVERVHNRDFTDKTVGDIFGSLSREELLKRLSEANIAFAEVNTMADLTVHPHLCRITVDTPNGPVSCPAPSAIWIDAPRSYGDVPGIIASNIMASDIYRLEGNLVAESNFGVALLVPGREVFCFEDGSNASILNVCPRHGARARLDHHIGRTGNQVRRLQQPIDRRFRDKVFSLAGKAHRQLPRWLAVHRRIAQKLCKSQRRSNFVFRA
jgi:hypothetical protein